MLRKTTLGAIAVLVTSISAIGYAVGNMENDALTSPAAKTSLSQAINKAEQHAKGRALRAEYEDSKLGWV